MVLNLDVQVLEDRRVLLSGTSNLPDMTEFMASVGNRRSGFMAQSRGTVIDGTFKIEPLGPASGLASGIYEAEITTPYARYQLESVQAVIGTKGQALRGPLVSRDSFGSTVTAKNSFKVGTASVADEVNAGKETSALARQVYTQIQALLQQGRSLGSLRNARRDDLNASRICGNRMRTLQPQAEQLLKAASELPRPYSFSLGSAAAALRVCVSCSSAGDDACRQVTEILAEVKADIR